MRFALLLLLCVPACAPAPSSSDALPQPTGGAPDSSAGVSLPMNLPTLPDTTVTVRGIYASGFEESSFRRCEQSAEGVTAGTGWVPGEVWWLAGDAAFADRYAELQAAHVPDRLPASRVYVEAELTGTLQRGGRFGHLGLYDARFVVTETHGMTFLALDPATTPPCSE